MLLIKKVQATKREIEPLEVKYGTLKAYASECNRKSEISAEIPSYAKVQKVISRSFTYNVLLFSFLPN